MNFQKTSFSGNPDFQSGFKTAKTKVNGIKMKVDLLKFHVSEEDTNIRCCLRAYTILPKFCKKPGQRNRKAEAILREIWKVRDKMKQKFGIKWGVYVDGSYPLQNAIRLHKRLDDWKGFNSIDRY
jgi:hypothetical protein